MKGWIKQLNQLRSWMVLVIAMVLLLMGVPFTIEAASDVDRLRQLVQEKAQQYKLPAEDARIDRVWKAIPGIEGRQLNIEETVQRLLKMKWKANGQQELPAEALVFETITPKVQLQDLNPAPIYRANPQKQGVAFLVNVAWGTEYLPGMLKTFREHGVKVNFFLDGAWAEKEPELVKLMQKEGHLIGSHAYNHPMMSKLSSQQAREQIQKTNQIIQKITDKSAIYFAPPAGDFNQSTVDVAAQEGMYTILWTVDTVDWRKPAPDLLIQRVMSQVENGSLVLMHPTNSTAAALPTLLKRIEKKGLQIIRLDHLLSPSRLLDAHEQSGND
ncbi:polysaccharide deacetylase family protein [Rubeoparvulum massiliense]|uniref:polysaccharide deacetylase family protein n=1 Tax=Rubeoparvulum massiliense TaxID=1631346 RepID=UPI00065E4435|nr:polysaccharide deacetylase family protein [Rubeoparvulum massiliense]